MEHGETSQRPNKKQKLSYYIDEEDELAYYAENVDKEIMVDFIDHASTTNYGKVKLVLNKNRYLVESPFPEVLKRLLSDQLISRAAIVIDKECTHLNGTKEFHSFEIDPAEVENVKQRCFLLNYPLLEEYDFENDACRIKKSCLCLATNDVSVDQWADQFKLWSNIPDGRICRFTSDSKKMFSGNVGVVVTTYNMLAFGGERSQESEKIIEKIRNREWGLLLMDEVHVVPASTFRKVVSIAKSHCKLRLTATLVREDEKITDLNFLIGPKLYEANWVDLVTRGYIANVLCSEVRCPMTEEFRAECLKKENSKKKQALCAMNPNKFRACEFLIRFHEQERGHKIIVFSDNIFSLEKYARKLHKPMIHGGTGHVERTIISSHAASRRQEAQRLGRILRAKDTEEMDYSPKRQQFLIDQGYSFKVLSAGDDAVGMDILKDDADGKGSMSARTGQKGDLAKSKPKVPAKRHQLFAKRFSRK
nr:homolog of Xeroderma pigmentosum complementation group B 2 [Tanacetum cinerariifolium]